jgi:hypothetical protein
MSSRAILPDLPSKDGWQEVADYALDWALGHATQAAATRA